MNAIFMTARQIPFECMTCSYYCKTCSYYCKTDSYYWTAADEIMCWLARIEAIVKKHGRHTSAHKASYQAGKCSELLQTLCGNSLSRCYDFCITNFTTCRKMYSSKVVEAESVQQQPLERHCLLNVGLFH